MELLFLTLIIVLPLIALDAITVRYGVDSRLAVEDGKGRAAIQRWILAMWQQCFGAEALLLP